MAQRVSVELDDDLTGGPADETVRFSLDGASYEIDLSAANAEKFRSAVSPFAEHARRATNGRAAVKRQRTGVDRERSGAIRAWAKEAGITVSERGRIPASVQDAYDNRGNAPAPQAAPPAPPAPPVAPVPYTPPAPARGGRRTATGTGRGRSRSTA